MQGDTARRLIWVPIIHTPEDLGSALEAVRRHYIRKVGKRKWDEHLRTVEDLWRVIQERIEALHLDYDKVHLYQDGLPVCGHEEAIVSDLAAKGSLNHRILVDLMARGATLSGTESPELLIREYTLARQLLDSLGTSARANTIATQQKRGKDVLHQRDAFIAERIGQTLQPGETGLVFLGMLHSLKGRLPADIQLVHLDVLDEPHRTSA